MQAPDQYRRKATECLELARKTSSSADKAWHRFLGMAMLWLRLAEQSERSNRFETTGADRP